ncbi:MAG: hypothetical protein RLZZ626_841, partial [Actinomycetota bacterium]
MNDWILLAIAGFLTVCTGLFVASEFSMVNLERNELEARRERGERGLSNTIRALSRTSTHMWGAQLGITLTTMLTGFLAEPAMGRLIKPTVAEWGFSADATRNLSLVTTLVIITATTTLFGELVPKKLALSVPLKVNQAVVGFQLAFTWTFGWAIFVLNKVGRALVRSLGIEPKEELSSTRSAEELAALVRRSAKLGALDQHTATLLTKTLALSQLVAADVMTPRPRVFTLDRDQTAADVVALCNKTGHSRFPIIDGSSDDVVGLVHVKQAAAVPRAKRASVPVSAFMV